MKKWKTEQGSVVMAQEGLPLSDSFIAKLLHEGEELESAGRGNIRRGKLPSGESYILRTYFRGGAARHLSEKRFLNVSMSPYRPFLEFEMTDDLFRRGVKVPRPLFAVVQFGFLNLSYGGMIATEEIPQARTLPEVPPHEGQSLAAERAGREAVRALECGYFHRDLHPGTVLVKENGEILLIDFDKALRIRSRDLKKYYEKLVERWNRAVLKNDYRREISDAFRRGVFGGKLTET